MFASSPTSCIFWAAQEKLAVMEECGIKVTKNPAEMGKLLKSVLK